MRELCAGDLPWRPGAYDALRVMGATGLPTALVTSSERSLTEAMLDTIGHEFFDVIVCGDEVDGLNKPHPEPYLRAARLLGVDARRCVAIEDSPVGTTSAVAAGCTVLVVPCAGDVLPGEGRVLRDSLVGLAPEDLTHLLAKPVESGHGALVHGAP
jgi:HAD superfamily hydrolase (TIGR01509 family)